MKLSKISTEVVSEKNLFASQSTNFNYEIIVFTGNGSNQISGSATKKNTDSEITDSIVASFNGFGKVQLNVQFNTELTLQEKIELVTIFNEVVTTTQA